MAMGALVVEQLITTFLVLFLVFLDKESPEEEEIMMEDTSNTQLVAVAALAPTVETVAAPERVLLPEMVVLDFLLQLPEPQ